jgi:predicted branched-subunit amino acid permease
VTQREEQRDDRRQIVRDSLGVGIATGTYGVSFGAVSVGSGLDVLQTCALSLLMFTGASQFALVGVLASGGAPFSAGPVAGASRPPTCSSTSRPPCR